MTRAKKRSSATPGLIIIGSIIFSIIMANPMFFFAAVLFVWIFGDKL